MPDFLSRDGTALNTLFPSQTVNPLNGITEIRDQVPIVFSILPMANFFTTQQSNLRSFTHMFTSHKVQLTTRSSVSAFFMASSGPVFAAP
eukprot:3659206-Heterocapsa_arctica.AAC.1